MTEAQKAYVALRKQGKCHEEIVADLAYFVFETIRAQSMTDSYRSTDASSF